MGDLVCHVVDPEDRRLVTVETGEHTPIDSERLSGEGRHFSAEATVP